MTSLTPEWLQPWINHFRQNHIRYQTQHLASEIDALSQHIEHCVNKRLLLRLEHRRLQAEITPRRTA